MLIYDQFSIIQNRQMSPIPQTNFLVGTRFAASDSKTTLVISQLTNENEKRLLTKKFTICILLFVGLAESYIMHKLFVNQISKVD